MATTTRAQPSPIEQPSRQPAPFSDLLTPRSAIPTPFPVEWIPFSAPVAGEAASEKAYTTSESVLPFPLPAHLATPSSPSALPYLAHHPSTGTLGSFNSAHAPSIDSYPSDYPFLAHPWEGTFAPNSVSSSMSGREGRGALSTAHHSRKANSNGGNTLRRLSSALRLRTRGEQFGVEELDQVRRDESVVVGSASRGASGATLGYIELEEAVNMHEGGQWQRQVQQWESAEQAKGFETTEQMVKIDQKTADALRMMGL